MAHFYGAEFKGGKFNRAYEHVHKVLSEYKIKEK